MLWATPGLISAFYVGCVEFVLYASGYIHRVIDRVRVSVCVHVEHMMMYAWCMQGEEKRREEGKKCLLQSVGLDSSLARFGW